MTKDELVLPRKINAANPATFGRTAEEHSSDTFNLLRKLKDRLLGLVSRVGDLTGLAILLPTNIRSNSPAEVGTSTRAAREDHRHDVATGEPVQGIGGGNTEGVSARLARRDHDHTFRETSGPTDMLMGAILAGESIRRVAGVLTGRLVGACVLTANQATTSGTAVDVSAADMSFDLKAGTAYVIIWFFMYSTAATTTGLLLGMNYSGTTSLIRYGILGATSLTGMQSLITSTNDGLLGQAAVGPGGTGRATVLAGSYITVTAGTLRLRYASGVAGSAVNPASGSIGLLIQL